MTVEGVTLERKLVAEVVADLDTVRAALAERPRAEPLNPVAAILSERASTRAPPRPRDTARRREDAVAVQRANHAVDAMLERLRTTGQATPINAAAAPHRAAAAPTLPMTTSSAAPYVRELEEQVRDLSRALARSRDETKAALAARWEAEDKLQVMRAKYLAALQERTIAAPKERRREKEEEEEEEHGEEEDEEGEVLLTLRMPGDAEERGRRLMELVERGELPHLKTGRAHRDGFQGGDVPG